MNLDDESVEGTVLVYWNSNIFKQYDKTIGINLWKVIVNINYFSTETSASLRPLREPPLPVNIDEARKTISIILGQLTQTFGMDEIVMEIPVYMYEVFSGLELYKNIAVEVRYGSDRNEWIYNKDDEDYTGPWVNDN